jgi:D-glycero-alpha-D-manno-heptose-7-phosphate kinase
MIISRTPYRISFFGGGTDYPDWYREHGGKVLGTTIDHYCYLTCRPLPPFFTHKYRLAYSKVELFDHFSEVQHPSVRETLKHLNVEEGISVTHDGDLPAWSGMGSSSAFTVGLVNVLAALRGKRIGKSELADTAIHIEQNLIKENVGSQDQCFAAYGGFNLIRFPARTKIEVEPMITPKGTVQALESKLMLFYTGISRQASEIAAGQIKNIPNRTSELNTLLQFVEEALKVLSRGSEDLDSFGKLLHESWLVKKSLSQKITNPAIDEIYDIGRKAGALGGKVLGAGGGGFVLFYAPVEKQAAIRAALKKLVYVPFRFESRGSEIILYRNENYLYSNADSLPPAPDQ